MPADDMAAPHLEAGEVAAYIDRRLAPAERDRVEKHLSACHECRGEVIEVAHVARTLPRRRRWHWLAPAVAAAAVILFIVATSKGIQQFTPDTGHRGEQGTAPVAPVPVAPAGPVATVDTLLWSSVPHTNRYRVRLFDADGAMIWQTQTRDTAVALPTSVRVNPGVPYYWRAEAWGDSFPLRQVARFASWSPEERVAKVAADSIRRAGNAALGRSGADSAILSWRESARRSAALADTAGIAAAVGNIGAGFYRAGKLDSAESYLEQSRRLAELVGDRRTALNALGTLGSVSKDRGELRRAADRYTRAFAIRQQIGDFRGMAADRNNLGLIAQLLGDLDEARRAYEDALGLSRAHGLDEPAAVSLVNLGDVASLQADYAEAIARFGEALAIYRHLGSRVDAAYVLHSLGLLELQRGDYPNAIARLSDAAAVYQQTGPVPEAVSVRKDLAFAYAATGNLQRALIELRGAGRLSGRGPLAPGLGATLALARADLAAQFNNFAQADREYAQAEALYRRWGGRSAGSRAGAGASGVA